MGIDGISGTQVFAAQTTFTGDRLSLRPNEEFALKQEVSAINSQVTVGGRQMKQVLDKDDFLKLMIEELRHQDPTQPMQDKEFIAQMAQFSSLEQVRNMSSEIKGVADLVIQGQALSMLGKQVEIMDGTKMIEGIVEKVESGSVPRVLVNDTYYDLASITRVGLATKGE